MPALESVKIPIALKGAIAGEGALIEINLPEVEEIVRGLMGRLKQFNDALAQRDLREEATVVLTKATGTYVKALREFTDMVRFLTMPPQSAKENEDVSFQRKMLKYLTLEELRALHDTLEERERVANAKVVQ